MKYIIATIIAAALSGCVSFNLDGIDLNAAKDIACNAVLNDVISAELPKAFEILEAAGLKSWICDAIEIDTTAAPIVTLEQVEALL